MSGLPREVLKWIQSLDLTWQVKTPKWDITNGYLIAEIFSWYFPQDIQMHSYNNGKSLDSKQKNWDLLNNFIKRHRLEIPAEIIDGTIHCKEGAAALLLERMYEILTNRVTSGIRKLPPDYEVDFTDRGYQNKLPMHARSTATQSVKNNLRITEIQADSSLILNSQKAQKIINEHIDHRRLERRENPDRFNIKPSVGESSFRRPYPQQTENGEQEQQEMNEPERAPSPISRETSVHFKEVQVKQLDKNALYNMPIQGC
ncbi:spermatogenesis-associated protein 4 [Mactra antiquata]